MNVPPGQSRPDPDLESPDSEADSLASGSGVSASGVAKPSLGKILARSLAGLAVTAVFVFLLVRFVPLEPMLSAIASAAPELLVASLLLVILGQVLRGWRIAILISPRAVPSFTAYRISVLHNFLASLLPARLGELALPAMLKRSYGIGFAAGAGILLGARILDLLIILSVAGISFWAVVPAGSELGGLRALGLIGGLAAIAGFLAMQHLRRLCAHLAEHQAWQSDPSKRGRVPALFLKLLQACAAIPPRRILLAQISSLTIWITLFAAYHAAALAVASAVSFDTTLLAGTLGSIAFVLPVNGIAQVGPFEAAWAFGAVLGGLSLADALAAAVTIHAVTFVGGLLQAAGVIVAKRGRGRS